MWGPEGNINPEELELRKKRINREQRLRKKALDLDLMFFKVRDLLLLKKINNCAGSSTMDPTRIPNQLTDEEMDRLEQIIEYAEKFKKELNGVYKRNDV